MLYTLHLHNIVQNYISIKNSINSSPTPSPSVKRWLNKNEVIKVALVISDWCP